MTCERPNHALITKWKGGDGPELVAGSREWLGWILSRSVYVYISIYDGHVMMMPLYPVPSSPFPLSDVLVASTQKSRQKK